jgi:SAM-dependent methyltransferase
VFRKDLFEGTAEDYERFRPPYPAALIDDLRTRARLGPASRVLDLACGTGQIAFAISPHVAEVVAVDPERGSVEFGRRKCERLGVANISWVTASAETMALAGAFDLVAIGNAFHRLDREAVARRLVPHLIDGGCLALLWSGSPWEGAQPWHRVFWAVLERWQDRVSARDRIPAGWQEAIDRDPHAAVLRRVGLTYESAFDFPVTKRWTVETLAGFVYSTSFLNRAVLGDQVDAFARDLASALLDCRPDGVFEQELTFVYELARRV